MQDICKKVFKNKIDLTPTLVKPTSGIGPKGTNKLVLIAPSKSCLLYTSDAADE